MKQRILITCEHGGNNIPDSYLEVFSDDKDILATHQGYDIGALELYQLFAEDLADAAYYSETSRLLVELNRSEHNKQLYSEITTSLPDDVKTRILEQYYYPYRHEVEDKIAYFVKTGFRVIHISVHSFTPELNGQVRDGDVGLLFDPERKLEKDFCKTWKRRLLVLDPDLLVKFNYPYKGTADGFTTYLRTKFDSDQYVGIELEVNQKFPLNQTDYWQHVQRNLHISLRSVITGEQEST